MLYALVIDAFQGPVRGLQLAVYVPDGGF